jgi:hypothetical protein
MWQELATILSRSFASHGQKGSGARVNELKAERDILISIVVATLLNLSPSILPPRMR